MKAPLLSLFLFFASPAVVAQEKHVAEVFGGYSYTRISPETSVRRDNINGGHASLTISSKFLDWSADFSGHKGGSLAADVTVYNLMFGPRFGRRGKKVSWYMHSLYGASKIATDVRAGGVAGASGGLSVGLHHSKTNFASVPCGGGVDVKVTDKISIRLFQFDLMFISRTYPLSALNPRVSTGLVIRLGKK